MAFTTRAERSTLHNLSGTPQNVGPGTYSGPKSSQQEPSYAPFSSTAVRDLAEHPPKYLPGPGEYAVDEALLHHQSKSVVESPAFASRVERLARDKSTKQETPPPGAYQEGNAWIKNNHRYKPSSSVQRVSFNRAPTAPSVPARHQSYGYEEGPAGELVMQVAPEDVRTGRGPDRVGPTDYNPTVDAVKIKQSDKAATWSNSKSVQHEVFSAKESPGPGSYDPVVDVTTSAINYRSIGGQRPRDEAGRVKKSSNFSSRVPRPFQSVPEPYDVSPGPGTYSITDSQQAVVIAAPPPEHQFFGSTQKRGFQVNKTTALHSATNFKTPGPGSYNPDRPGRKPISGILPDQVPGFQSTTARFTARDQVAPAIGQYDEHDNYGLASSVNKKLVSRTGAFGSTAGRFGSQTNNPYSEAPSPASYDPGAGESERTVGRNKQSSMFKSSSNRFATRSAPAKKTVVQKSAEGDRPQHNPAALGPGTYSLQDPWNPSTIKQRSRRQGNVFISQEDRFGRNSALGTANAGAPGPGRYSHTKEKDAFKPFVRQVPGTGFSSQASRFKNSTSLSPGPGSYNADDPSAGIVKRSFNVTVDELGFY